MNRPIIKGTANHKASIAKAKAESIVSQRRTQADAGLVSAADTLGKSYKPQAIDYSIKQKGIDFLDIKKEKKAKAKSGYEDYLDDIGATAEDVGEEKGVLSEKDWKQLNKQKTKKEKNNSLKVSNKTKRADEKASKLSDEFDSYVEYMQGQRLDNQIINQDDYEALSRRERRKLVGKKNIFEKFTDKIKAKKEQNEIDFQAEQKDKSIIQAEKDAAKLEADKLKQAELDKKEIEKALALERRNEEKLKKRLIREEAAERRKNRNKKGIIDVGEVKTTGIGDKQINQQTRQYTKEQREKLNTGEEGGNIWSNDLERYVLPEEIVDGQFVSKAEGETIIVSPNIKGKTTEPVVEEKKTLSNLEIRKKRMRDRKYNDPNTSQYIKDQMLKEGYVPNESKSPTQMRDNRIYRNAVKGGAVQRNMIKSGYKPE